MSKQLEPDVEAVVESQDPEARLQQVLYDATDAMITEAHRLYLATPARGLRLLEAIARTQVELFGELGDVDAHNKRNAVFGGGMADQLRPMVDIVERMATSVEAKQQPKPPTRRQELTRMLRDLLDAGISPNSVLITELQEKLTALVQAELHPQEAA